MPRSAGRSRLPRAWNWLRPSTRAMTVLLDVSTRMPAEVIIRRLPSMHHQFKELADVDITAEPMEVGPTCHYVMGGVEVDPDTAAAPASPACSRPARSPAACTAPTGSAATRCPTCWCSAAGPGWARPSTSTGWRRRPTIAEADIDAAADAALGAVRARRRRREPVHAPPGTAAVDERPGRHHPQGGARWSRRSAGWPSCASRVATCASRGTGSSTPAGTWRWTCGTCCCVSECVARAALERQESRGGHTREDYPAMDARVAQVNCCLLRSTADGVAPSSHRSDRMPRDARRPAGPVREGRAEEVPHRRGAADEPARSEERAGRATKRTSGCGGATPTAATSRTTRSR